MKKLAKRVRAIEAEVEDKYFDITTPYANVVIDNTAPQATTVCLCTPVQGNDVNDRVGDEVTIKKLELRMAIKQSTTVITECRVRVSVIWYKNSNTLALFPPQVWTTGLALAIPHPTFAMRNHQYKDSFTMIYDKQFILKSLDWDGTTNVIPDIHNVIIKKRLNKKVQYIAGPGAGTFADINNNGLWLMISTSAGTAGNVLYTLNSRVTFTDA